MSCRDTGATGAAAAAADYEQVEMGEVSASMGLLSVNEADDHPYSGLQSTAPCGDEP